MRYSLLTIMLCAVALVYAEPVAAASLSSCVKSLKTRVIRNGVPRHLANKALANVKYDKKVIRFSRSQPEYRTPIWDYMTFLVDDARIARGHAMMKKYDRTLRAVERKYKVNRFVVAAFWGVESDFGAAKGDFFLPHALANLVCAGRKPRFFRRELISALKLVKRGDLELNELYGSWAGAFGQTQFIPSTYARLAVDFDRDGKRDLVRSVPDALASTANYMRKAGWRPGGNWLIEVKIPRGYKGPHGRKRKHSLSSWAKRGLIKVNGQRLSGSTKAGLLLPAGKNGPAFLVFRNFDAIYSYNAALSYALAVSHLADRLAGYPAFRTPWPTNDPGLNRRQRKELQILLLKSGYDIGEADGKIGPATKKAIKKVQKKAGMKANGRPSMKVYRALGGG